MSLSTMTPAGELPIPTQGGGATSLETLARITALEQELADLKRSVASDTAYGLAKVMNATDVTEGNGIALSAMQNNSTINGSLRNEIEKAKNWIEEYRTKIFLQDLGSVGHEIADDVLSYMKIDGYWITVGYCFHCTFPNSEDAFIIGLDVTGTTPMHSAAGSQLLLSTWGSVRIRRNAGQGWSEWKDLFL